MEVDISNCKMWVFTFLIFLVISRGEAEFNFCLSRPVPINYAEVETCVATNFERQNVTIRATNHALSRRYARMWLRCALPTGQEVCDDYLNDISMPELIPFGVSLSEIIHMLLSSWVKEGGSVNEECEDNIVSNAAVSCMTILEPYTTEQSYTKNSMDLSTAFINCLHKNLETCSEVTRMFFMEFTMQHVKYRRSLQEKKERLKKCLSLLNQETMDECFQGFYDFLHNFAASDITELPPIHEGDDNYDCLLHEFMNCSLLPVQLVQRLGTFIGLKLPLDDFKEIPYGFNGHYYGPLRKKRASIFYGQPSSKLRYRQADADNAIVVVLNPPYKLPKRLIKHVELCTAAANEQKLEKCCPGGVDVMKALLTDAPVPKIDPLTPDNCHKDCILRTVSPCKETSRLVLLSLFDAILQTFGGDKKDNSPIQEIPGFVFSNFNPNQPPYNLPDSMVGDLRRCLKREFLHRYDGCCTGISSVLLAIVEDKKWKAQITPKTCNVFCVAEVVSFFCDGNAENTFFSLIYSILVEYSETTSRVIPDHFADINAIGEQPPYHIKEPVLNHLKMCVGKLPINKLEVCCRGISSVFQSLLWNRPWPDAKITPDYCNIFCVEQLVNKFCIPAAVTSFRALVYSVLEHYFQLRAFPSLSIANSTDSASPDQQPLPQQPGSPSSGKQALPQSTDSPSPGQQVSPQQPGTPSPEQQQPDLPSPGQQPIPQQPGSPDPEKKALPQKPDSPSPEQQELPQQTGSPGPGKEPFPQQPGSPSPVQQVFPQQPGPPGNVKQLFPQQPSPPNSVQQPFPQQPSPPNPVQQPFPQQPSSRGLPQQAFPQKPGPPAPGKQPFPQQPSPLNPAQQPLPQQPSPPNPVQQPFPQQPSPPNPVQQTFPQQPASAGPGKQPSLQQPAYQIPGQQGIPQPYMFVQAYLNGQLGLPVGKSLPPGQQMLAVGQSPLPNRQPALPRYPSGQSAGASAGQPPVPLIPFIPLPVPFPRYQNQIPGAGGPPKGSEGPQTVRADSSVVSVAGAIPIFPGPVKGRSENLAVSVAGGIPIVPGGPSGSSAVAVAGAPARYPIQPSGPQQPVYPAELQGGGPAGYAMYPGRSPIQPIEPQQRDRGLSLQQLFPGYPRGSELYNTALQQQLFPYGAAVAGGKGPAINQINTDGSSKLKQPAGGGPVPPAKPAKLPKPVAKRTSRPPGKPTLSKKSTPRPGKTTRPAKKTTRPAKTLPPARLTGPSVLHFPAHPPGLLPGHPLRPLPPLHPVLPESALVPMIPGGPPYKMQEPMDDYFKKCYNHSLSTLYDKCCKGIAGVFSALLTDQPLPTTEITPDVCNIFCVGDTAGIHCEPEAKAAFVEISYAVLLHYWEGSVFMLPDKPPYQLPIAVMNHLKSCIDKVPQPKFDKCCKGIDVVYRAILTDQPLPPEKLAPHSCDIFCVGHEVKKYCSPEAEDAFEKIAYSALIHYSKGVLPVCFEHQDNLKP